MTFANVSARNVANGMRSTARTTLKSGAATLSDSVGQLAFPADPFTRASSGVIPRVCSKITEDKDLSITACRRADLVCTTVVDVSMAAVTIVVLVMVVALILRPVG